LPVNTAGSAAENRLQLSNKLVKIRLLKMQLFIQENILLKRATVSSKK